MIRSMTGFASRTLSLAIDAATRANCSVSLKSLNSRFFESTCRIPYQINSIETTIIKYLNTHLRRGHVYVTIHVDNQAIFKGTVSPVMSVVEGYLAATDQIKKSYAIPGEISITSLLPLPNVFSIQEGPLPDQAKNAILATVQELTQELIAAQEKEGAALMHDILERTQTMEQLIEHITGASKQLVEKQKAKIADLVQAAGADEAKQAELHKHLAYTLLDKIDIHEELVRFKTHLANLKKQFASTEIELGKRLDFTLQELAREVNTITAKCADATIGSMAIDIKVELEKVREQVQNIV